MLSRQLLTFRIFLRNPLKEATLMQPMNPSTMYCAQPQQSVVLLCYQVTAYTLLHTGFHASVLQQVYVRKPW